MKISNPYFFRTNARCRSTLATLALASVVALACSSESTHATGPAGGTGTPAGNNDQDGNGGSTSSDDSEPSQWETLIEGAWTLEAGGEGYQCILIEAPKDMYVNGFRPVSPTGTHHTVLSRALPPPFNNFEPQQIACDGNAQALSMLYSSGVGTNPLEFPEGVAIKIDKGEQLLLNVHLFNVTPDELKRVTGIEVLTIPEAEVQHLADVVLAGTEDLEVAPGETEHTGYCTQAKDTTIFAVWPHMHQFGKHMVVTAEQEGNDIVLLDEPYSFEAQTYTVLDNLVELAEGERVRVDCTHFNPGGETAEYGESTTDEMCYAGIYRYPADPLKGVTCTE